MPDESKPYQVTDADRQLVAMRACRPESAFRAAFPRMDTDQRRRLFDAYFALADRIPQLPGGLTPARRRIRANLDDFAYRLSDASCDWLERLRYRIPKKWPAYATEIARLRARGRVPAPVNGVHVFVALRFQYRGAAPGACVVVQCGPDFETFDYRFLAGLDVQFLATRADLGFADWLTRRIAADGANKITLRRLDDPAAPAVTLHDAGRPWRL